MPLTDADVTRIMKMSHFELVRGAVSEDMAVGIEATLRLKRSTEILTWALIFLAAIAAAPVLIDTWSWVTHA